MRIYHLVEAESLWALSQRGAVNLPQVKELQDRLRAAGHDPGPSDGWYGPNTVNAVRQYQQANNLKVDGDAGPQTLSSLGMPSTPSSSRPASATDNRTNAAPGNEPATINTPTGNPQVDRAANQGGEALARLIIGGLLGYGLYRAAQRSGQTPPPLGSNPITTIPEAPPPTPVRPTSGISITSSVRDVSRAINAVSQGQFFLTDWTPLSTLDQAYLKLALEENSQLASGFLQLRNSNNRQSQADYISYINRYIRRQINLIPGNVGNLSVSVYYRTSLIGRFDTYLG